MLFRFGPEDLHDMRILIVEDEYLLAADLAEAMLARGAEVIGPVGTLAEAMKAVETNWIDRAVLDLDLPAARSRSRRRASPARPPARRRPRSCSNAMSTSPSPRSSPSAVRPMPAPSSCAAAT
jgi:CheY-like chemotaxis protein